jgi:hypothetical protein
MTTRELVVRMAAYFGGWPHEIWAWPFHYYLAVRAEYLKIHGMARPVNKPQGHEIVAGVMIEYGEEPR